MYCNNCKICNRLIISNSVTVVTVAGVDTLLIDIPAATYMDGWRYCLVVAQTIPNTATINMPVAITIGGVTTTVYPLTRCDCAQVTACAIRTRTKYPVLVSTNATGGVFKVLAGLSCTPNNTLASLPVATTATTAAVETPAVAPAAAAPVVANFAVASTPARTTKTTKTKTTTTKGGN